MTRVGLLCVAVAASAWLVGCSRLFDSDRAQCSKAADCAALGHPELRCVSGLCALGTDSDPQDRADAGPSLGDGGDGQTGDGADEGDGADDGSHASDGGDDADVGDGTGDGSVGDGDPNDGGVVVEAPPDCPYGSPALRFCDGFEYDFAPWNREVDEGTRLSIVSDPVVRGARSLEAVTDERGARWAEVHATFPEIRGEPLWARAFLWVHGDMDYDVITVLRIESRDESQGIDLSLQGGAAQGLMFTEFSGSEREAKDPRRFPTDKWTCVELSFTPSLLTGTANLFVDGQLAASFDTALPNAAFERVRTGIFFTSEDQVPVQLGVDAVAVSTQRIGCD